MLPDSSPKIMAMVSVEEKPRGGRGEFSQGMGIEAMDHDESLK